MRTVVLPLVLGAVLALPVAAPAQQSFGDTVSGIAQTMLQQQMDRSAFADAQRLDTPSAYQSYLMRYPNGLHKADAEQALRRLLPPVMNPDPGRPGVYPPRPGTDPVALEAAIGLSRLEKTEIQRQLTDLGYDTRGADGLWGANTRAAIARWQAANRQPQTGYVTREQLRQIAEQHNRLAPVRPGPGSSAEQAEKALDLAPAERREIQLRLTLLGHSTQGTNGSFGPLTRSAIADWQRKQGEPATGYMTADQVRKLQRQTGG